MLDLYIFIKQDAEKPFVVMRSCTSARKSVTGGTLLATPAAPGGPGRNYIRDGLYFVPIHMIKCTSIL